MGLCQICQQPWEWHEQHHPRHQFIGSEDDPRLGLAQVPTPSNSMRGDPVLRLALIKAGVISEVNISEAEVWVREAAATGQAVVVDSGEFKLVSIEEWIKALAG
jgi:hypothetical protein